MKQLTLLFLMLLLTPIFVLFPAYSQLSTPYNLDFEDGFVGSPVYGWSLGRTASDSSYVAYTSDIYLTGSLGATITSVGKKQIKQNVASFYQSLDASIYRHRRVRFTANVLVQELATNATISMGDTLDYSRYITYNAPHLFITTRNRKGQILTQNDGGDIFLRGWNNVFVDVPVPADAAEIRFGISFTDTNDISIDDCKFAVVSQDSLHYERPSPLTELELEYLLPFASIAGGIQHFHPSKAASEADWDNVLLSGMSDMAEYCKDMLPNLANRLQQFFSQLAPQIQIGTQPINIKNLKIESKPTMLAYLYTGVPTNVRSNTQTSYRIVDLNSSIITTDAVVAQYIQIPQNSGSKDKIEVKVKVKVQKFQQGALANIQLRFEDAEGNYISFLKKDSIVSDKWQSYTLTGNIPDSCTSALFILSFRGYGRAFFDDASAKVTIGGKASSIAMRNPSFEYNLPFNNSNWLTTNASYDAGYVIGYSDREKTLGKQSLVIGIDSLATPKFPTSQQYWYSTAVGSGLYAAYNVVVPAELFTKRESDTLGMEHSIVSYATYPSSEFTSKTSKPDGFMLNWNDRASRLVECIKVYNLLRNFSLTPIDSIELNTAFEVALRGAALCESKKQYRDILQEFIALTKDNRSRVWYIGDDDYYYSLPFNMEYADGKVYITNVDSSATSKLNTGDEVVSFNGVAMPEWIGLPQWQVQKALIGMRIGSMDSEVSLQIRHNGVVEDMRFTRSVSVHKMQFRAINYSQPIDDSTLYIDLTAYKDEELDRYYDSIAHYSNYIFDLRGDAMVSENFLTLLYDKIFQTSQVCVPYFTLPDKRLMSYHPGFTYYYPSEKKHLKGKFVFLIDWRTHSYGELLASTIKDYGIGMLVGNNTQGTLVTGVPIRLDADFSISLGTMYGASPKGQQLFALPVEPDVKVLQTRDRLDGDMILEEGMMYIRK
ncbi:MAG: hypothetical protein LBO69_07670 [Ignavibacteria bacterium]|nr:hypothetical protein [Ignavibacteria bacterium]